MEWINVNERLPEHNQKIKAKSDNLWNGEGIYQDGKFVYSWVKGACFGDITHWMPLPPPPKSDKGNMELVIYCYECKNFWQLNPDMIASALLTNANVWDVYNYIANCKCNNCSKQKIND